MKNIKKTTLLVTASVLVMVTVLMATLIPVESKLVKDCYLDKTRYSIILGQKDEFDTIENLNSVYDPHLDLSVVEVMCQVRDYEARLYIL